MNLQRQEVPRSTGRISSPVPVLLKTAENPVGLTSCGRPIGKVGVYAEPCMGTGVMLMNSPYGPAPREIACELNAFIPNFYRAVKYNYVETAAWVLARRYTTI